MQTKKSIFETSVQLVHIYIYHGILQYNIDILMAIDILDNNEMCITN